jgi:energy-coupling factor transporter ATP-binding protein EcfA2
MDNQNNDKLNLLDLKDLIPNIDIKVYNKPDFTLIEDIEKKHADNIKNINSLKLLDDEMQRKVKETYDDHKQKAIQESNQKQPSFFETQSISTTIEFNKYNLILGENGTGKSKISQKIKEMMKDSYLFDENWVNNNIILPKLGYNKPDIEIFVRKIDKTLEDKNKEYDDFIKEFEQKAFSGKKPDHFDVFTAINFKVKNKDLEKLKDIAPIPHDILFTEEEIHTHFGFENLKERLKEEFSFIKDKLKDTIVNLESNDEKEFLKGDLKPILSSIENIEKLGYLLQKDKLEKRKETILEWLDKTLNSEKIEEITKSREKTEILLVIEKLFSKIISINVEGIKQAIKDHKEKEKQEITLIKLSDDLKKYPFDFINDRIYKDFFDKGLDLIKIDKNTISSQLKDQVCPFCYQNLSHSFQHIITYFEYEKEKLSMQNRSHINTSLDEAKNIYRNLLNEIDQINDNIVRLKENDLKEKIEYSKKEFENTLNGLQDCINNIEELKQEIKDYQKKQQETIKRLIEQYNIYQNINLGIKKDFNDTIKVPEPSKVIKYFISKENINNELEIIKNKKEEAFNSILIDTNSFKDNFKKNWEKLGLSYLKIMVNNTNDKKLPFTVERKSSGQTYHSSELSEGERRILGLCSFITDIDTKKQNNKNIVIVLDDPFNSIDLENTEKCIEFLNKKQKDLKNIKQFFIFTHLPYVFESFYKNITGNDSIRYFEMFKIMTELDISKNDRQLKESIIVIPVQNGFKTTNNHTHIRETIAWLQSNNSIQAKENYKIYLAVLLRRDIEKTIISLTLKNNKNGEVYSLRNYFKKIKEFLKNEKDIINIYSNTSKILHYSANNYIKEEIGEIGETKPEWFSLQDIIDMSNEWIVYKHITSEKETPNV